MARPSPRTQGVDESGKTFQKFGTQQLSYVAPPVKGTTFQGVTERDVGKTFQTFTTALASPFRGKPSPTAFSQQFQAGITGHQSIMPRAEAIAMQDAKLREMGIPKFPDLGELEFPTWEDLFGANDKHGCECKACKEGTGQCSDKVPQCDSWDLLCEGSGGATVGVVGGTNWFFWIKIVLAVIGIGILLWLLRPLFGIVKNVSGVTKSAVTRVNGMK